MSRRSKRVKREGEDDAQLLSGHAATARASPELPTHILESLGLAASDLENPSKETFDKIALKLQETLGLLETARHRLNQYGDRTPLTVPSSHKSHCVRCHKDYAESQNMGKACVIAHWGDLDRVGKNSSGSTWEWSGCHCIVESDDYDDCDTDEACYEGRHTINPKEVEYEKDAQKDAPEPRRKYGDEDGVRTCKQRGCAGGFVKRKR